MTYTIRIKQSTTLKQSTNPAINLPADQTYAAAIGEYAIGSYDIQGKHYKFSLGKLADGTQITFNGKNTWFAYTGHTEILKDGKPIAPTSKHEADGSFMLMKPSGRTDQFGATLFNLSWVKGGRQVDSMLIVSGQAGKRGVRKEDDYSGSNRPCPEGEYTLGEVETGWFGDAIGAIWISVYGTEPRIAIGIHEDANRSYSPGSAGCLSPLNESDTRRVAAWRDAGCSVLIVDHGFNTLRY